MHGTVKDHIVFQSARRLAEAIRSGSITSRDLLERYLARIERYNPQVNAIVALDAATARAEADERDRRLAAGAVMGPFHGVPITIKDSFDVAGFASTWGMVTLKDNRPAYTARAVKRLIGAGAVVMGKTNVPATCVGWQTSNALFGTTNNPWNLALTPGGSTGGGAAALAAGLTGLDIASDLAGSLRNPAHYCGVYSHRPTWGIVDWEGQVFPGAGVLPDMAVTGPIARSSEDLRAALALIMGPREGEEIGWTVSLPACTKNSTSEFRVAMLLESEVSRVSCEVRDALCALAERLRSMGAQVSIGSFPDFDPDLSHATFTALMHAGFAGAVPDRLFEEAEAAVKSLEDSDCSRLATYLRNVNMKHRTWIKHDLARGQLQVAWCRFFRDYDVFLCPCAATAAPPHDIAKPDEERMIVVDGQLVPAIEQYFWAGLSSVAGLPATTAPIGLSSDGLPIGVQIIGPRFADETCLTLAGMLEDDHRGFVPPPGYS